MVVLIVRGGESSNYLGGSLLGLPLCLDATMCAVLDWASLLWGRFTQLV